MNKLSIFGAVTNSLRKAATLSPVSNSRGGWWPIVREPFAGAWQQNEELAVDTQLAYYAVYACVTLISNDFGKLRQKLMERQGAIWAEVSSAAFSPVLRRPNRYQNHIQFKEWWATSKLTRGNSYALKERDNRGIVVAEYLLNPDLVMPLVAEDGSVYYRLGQDNLTGIEQGGITVPASEIIHDRMNCLFHPLVGISPLYACGLAASQGLSIQSQSRKFFGNGARPSGVLTAPGSISDETAARLKAHWDTNYTGENAGKVAVLGDGLKYDAMTMKATDSQMIEQLKMTAEMVCAAFHVPAFKVGIGAMPTYQNGEMLNQIYYSDCLQSLIEQYELCQDEGLGIGHGVKVEGRELGIELDLDGLLRMDTATQIRTLGEAVKGSLISIDEAREKIDRPKTPGGATIWMQQQNYSLAALAERDRNDPFAKPSEPAKPADAPAPTGEPSEDEAEMQELMFEVLLRKEMANAQHA